jgi:hypothetical protein
MPRRHQLWGGFRICVSVHRAPHLLCCRALEVQKYVCEPGALHLQHPVNGYEFAVIDFKIMILARQSEEVVYVIRRRAITQSKIILWKSIAQCGGMRQEEDSRNDNSANRKKKRERGQSDSISASFSTPM